MLHGKEIFAIPFYTLFDDSIPLRFLPSSLVRSGGLWRGYGNVRSVKNG
jgi:hypothetical protein